MKGLQGIIYWSKTRRFWSVSSKTVVCFKWAPVQLKEVFLPPLSFDRPAHINDLALELGNENRAGTLRKTLHNSCLIRNCAIGDVSRGGAFYRPVESLKRGGKPRKFLGVFR